MGEENKNQDQTLDTENLKKETVETVNQVKETIKNVDIKNDAKEATGFVTSMFKDPFATIKTIADDSTNKAFKTAIIFLIIWVAAEFLDSALSIALISLKSLKNSGKYLIYSFIYSPPSLK